MSTLVSFFNSSFFIALITFIVGGFAIFLYQKQKADGKRDAAKLILQEIRRAEDIITDYKEHGQYKFTKKIIATNSWAKNIHYFVGDLDTDELDKISNLYSTGEYLDSIVAKVSDVKFEENIKLHEENINRVIQRLTNQGGSTTSQVPSDGRVQQPVPQVVASQQSITVPIAIPVPWKGLLDEITLKYEPIYHTTIAEKLKKIAKLK